MNLLRLFSRYYILTFLSAFVILVLCLMPIEDPPLKNVRFIDKWTHMVLFGGMCGVLFLEMTLNRLSRRWVTPIAAALFGGVVELLQAYCTTCRSGEWLDFVADAVGACVVYLLVLCIRHVGKFPRR